MKGYYMNLGLYNEGYLVGEWIDFPVDEDELHELRNKLQLIGHEKYEEFFFADWDDIGSNIVYDLGEYPDIELCNQLGEFNEDELHLIDVIAGDCNLQEAIDIVERGDYIDWPYDSMADVARHYVEDSGMEIPDKLAYYIDYEAMGRDIEIEGNFIYDKENHNYIEILH